MTSLIARRTLLTSYPPWLQLHGGLGSAGLAGTNPAAQRTAHDLVNPLVISCPGERRADDARSHLLWPRLIRKEHKDLASTSPSARHSTKPFPPPRPGGWSSASWHYTPKHGQLARSGGGRVRRSIVPMLLPPHPRQTNPHRRQRCLGARPQGQPHQGKLALHHPNARIKLKHLYTLQSD
jgi:hypothetical protein